MTQTDGSRMRIVVDGDFSALEAQFAELKKLSSRFSTSLSQAFVDATAKGNGLGATLRTLALRLSEITLKSVFSPLTSQLGSELAEFVGGQSGVGSLLGFAKGGAFAGSAAVPVPFADGGVIASPVAFPLSGGRTGLAGEAGAEAILPLARGPDGSLGVRTAGEAQPIAITFNVTTQDAESFRRSETQLAAMLARAVAQGQRNL